MCAFVVAAVAVASAAPYWCDSTAGATRAWCDVSLPHGARAAALVGALRDDEKAGLLSNNATAVPRLAIPAYNWWNEGLHGVARDNVSTSFPQIIGVGATFNRSLFRALGELVGVEARGKNNGVVGDGRRYHGLTVWAPNINIFRDPRWGRGQETPGEDPALNGAYAENYVAGMQGDEATAKFLRVSACLKHFAAYSEETGRLAFAAAVSAQDMADTYLPAFEQGVRKGRASAIMCSYNAETFGAGTGGGAGVQHGAVPSCANKGLLNDLARGEWGFDGYVTSDCGAVQGVQLEHNYTGNLSATASAVWSAGMDSDCGTYLNATAVSALLLRDGGQPGLRDGGQPGLRGLIDGALQRLIGVQLRLGFFDPPSHNPYAALGAESVDTPAHRALAREAADQSIVLLKNEGNTLPLSAAGVRSLNVVGRNANATRNMQGNYFGPAPFLISPLQGLSAYVDAAATATACLYECGDRVLADDDDSTPDAGPPNCSAAEVARAVASGAAHDATVLIVGLTSGSQECADESEGNDRTSLLLPGDQSEVIARVAASAAGAGKPVVLVIMGGSALDLSQFKADPNVGAILFVGYPGQAGGAAIADALFGATNPSGRLPITFYPESFAGAVSLFDMGMRPNATSGNPGRTHRFYTGGDEVYKFGDGLSYSRTSSALTLGRVLGAGGVVLGNGSTVAKATVSVTNSGGMDGDEIVLLFAAPPAGTAGVGGVPLQALVSFDKVHVKVGQTVDVELDVPADRLAFAGLDGELAVPTGEWQLWVGVRRAETRVVSLHV